MATQTLVLKDVPADEVPYVEAKYKAMGVGKIEKTKQSDGRFTLRITLEISAEA